MNIKKYISILVSFPPQNQKFQWFMGFKVGRSIFGIGRFPKEKKSIYEERGLWFVG